MVKTCAWGTCNNDTRYPERVENVRFIPFPKPKTNSAKCLRWIKACGRPHNQLNVSKIDRHKFVCSKHFEGGDGPSLDFPDPLSADGSSVQRSRSHWRQRQQSRNNPDNPDHKDEEVDMHMAADQDVPLPSPLQKPHEQDIGSDTSLQLLSAAAEIKRLKEQLHQYEVLCQHRSIVEQQQSFTTATACSISDSCETSCRTPLTVNSIINEESRVEGLLEYYTGFKHSTFQNLLQFLTTQGPQHQNNRKEIVNMGLDNQLLLTLMRLRHNFGLKDLAYRFSISVQAVSELFLTWIDHMYVSLGSIPIWPHRNDIVTNMPSKYKEEFPRSIAIIDCTELKTQKPSSLKLQSQMYSDYKSSTTLKALVACDPMGNLIFVSELFTGSMSDKEITAKSGFYALLQQLLDANFIEKGDAIMADKGFTITEELNNLGLNLNIPPFVSSGCQLTSSNVNITQTIAQHRIHVERAIRRIRTFNIISDLIPTSIFGSINKVWTVCSLLTLWQNPVLKYK